MIQRFPIAGLARDKRPAYWRGDFYEQRDGGQHSSYDTFVVKAPQATSERFKGAAIVATVDGHVPLRVSRTNTMGSGTSDRGGNFVWIEEAASPGTLHYFAHMRDTPLVQPGQQVRAGQLIGYLGDSGNARGRPHLHFSVRRPSGAVDVYDQLRAVEATAYEPPIVHGMLGIPWQRWAKVGIGASLAAGATLIAVYFLWPKPKTNPRRRRRTWREQLALGKQLTRVQQDERDDELQRHHYAIGDIARTAFRQGDLLGRQKVRVIGSTPGLSGPLWRVELVDTPGKEYLSSALAMEPIEWEG